MHSGRRLLAQGRAAEVLRVVRPVEPKGYIIRAEALRRLGRLADARREAKIGVAIGQGSSDGFRVLGQIEAASGNLGAALKALERSLELDPEQRCVRRDVARLLIWRAWFRTDPCAGLMQLDDARRELGRARNLEPCFAPQIVHLERSMGRGSCPAGDRPPTRCEGISDGLRPNRPLPRGRCVLPDASGLVRRLKQKGVLLGCAGPRAALALERAGCTAAAKAIWEELGREAPADPRWVLQQARIHLTDGALARARAKILDYVYLSVKERAAAMLSVARVLLLAGHAKLAARWAIEALPAADRLEQQLEAVGLLRRCGFDRQVQRGARVVMSTQWRLPRARILEALRRATGVNR
jgi:tetratricopeptide (TPR) repeat protein